MAATGNAGGNPPAPAKGAPPPLPCGKPGDPVLACQWRLNIKVHSKERFWPTDAFALEFGGVKPGPVPADSRIPPIGPAWYSSTVHMKAVDAPVVTFTGSGTKTGGVTAQVHPLKHEADWILSSGASSVTPLPGQYVATDIANGQERNVELFLRHPLRFHLEFKFKDPEKKELNFPKGFPIQIWSDSQITEKKTDEKGRIDIELDRKYDWVTLKFGGSQVWFSVGDGKAGLCELKADSDRKDLRAKDAKFFSPPDSWALVESIWKFSEEPKFIDGSPAYKDPVGKIHLYDPASKNWVRRIGEKDKPVVLTLDPHWTFSRLEFFDRYFGHTDHGHQRVNSPSVEIDSVWLDGKKAVREGSGHWTLFPDKADASVHAVPWIRQKGLDGSTHEKPDKDSYLRCATDADSYVVSQDAATRRIETVVAGASRLSPGANRLKLYDLPSKWESLAYWTRFGKGAKETGKFWQDWTAGDLLKSRAPGEPAIFSLDDIILSDAALNPLKFTAADPFAILYHRFKPAYDHKGDVSNHGVYKPDAQEPYFSDVKLKGGNFNYLVDYPNWVRALAGKAALFDAFDKRTATGVLGARAAVQWYDPIKSGAPAGGPVGFQPAIDKTHFVLEPYYGQEHHLTWQPYKSGGFRIGRFDHALLRNCDRLGSKELFIALQYFRLFYNFNASSTVKGAAQKAYMKDSAVALMNRWNGTPNAYVLAHELGHGGSMPDEYGEWWSRCSHSGPGVTCNIPGDPFVDEGRDFDLVGSLYGAAAPPYPMMTMTVEMRNRYFWHNAEFARKFVKESMFVKHGKYAEYNLPGHPQYPRRSYTYWPISAVTNAKLGAKGGADIYLHAAGKERFTVDLMPKGTYDGIVSVLLKIALYEATGTDTLFRDAIRNPMLAYNKKFFGSGTATVTTDAGNKDLDYARTIFRFSPRFLIQGVDTSLSAAEQASYPADFANLLARFGVHSSVNVVNAKGPGTGYNAATGKYDLIVDYADPNLVNNVSAWAQQYFREMIGLAFDPKAPLALSAKDLKPIAQAVFTKNGNVKDL